MTTGKVENKKYCIYIHTNLINNKKYVGITSIKPSYRWSNGNGYKRNIHFWNAIQKYGWDNFKHEIILRNETYEYACAVEKCLIKHYRTTNPLYGYNRDPGGHSGIPHTEETKQKMRASHADYSGENHPLYGKQHKQETKDKISKAHQGKKHTKETCEKMSRSRIGIKNGRAKKPVYCPELDEVFWGAKAVYDKYGFDSGSITAVCKGRAKHCGKHPITNQLLTWKYVDKDILIEHFIKILKQLNNKEVV